MSKIPLCCLIRSSARCTLCSFVICSEHVELNRGNSKIFICLNQVADRHEEYNPNCMGYILWMEQYEANKGKESESKDRIMGEK